jgi:membrane-associated phospholipid phosphatase
VTSAGWTDDLPQLVLGLAVGAFLLVVAWSELARHAPAAARVRAATRRGGGPGRLALAAVALLVFVALAEEVLDRGQETGAIVTAVDRHVRARARGWDALRPAARAVGWITGRGLVIALLGASGALLAASRARLAGVVLGGSAAAWALAQALKLAFRVARPGAPIRDWAITGYGFPSAHALVTVVVLGLVAWSVARGRSPATRGALYVAVAVLAALTAVARLIVGVHWASDVVAGIAAGVACLQGITILGDRLAPPPEAPAA